MDGAVSEPPLLRLYLTHSRASSSTMNAQQLQEDGDGLLMHGRFDDTATAEQVYRMVEARRLGQLSFGYDTLEEAPVALPGLSSSQPAPLVLEQREHRVIEPASITPLGVPSDAFEMEP